uniref:Uncharacterized protein n=1 Tax=Manihot esculenta TaxID=3983 RepID=A0A2C9VYC5_MANES
MLISCQFNNTQSAQVINKKNKKKKKPHEQLADSVFLVCGITVPIAECLPGLVRISVVCLGALQSDAIALAYWELPLHVTGVGV